jgi:hypothetical protein
VTTLKTTIGAIAADNGMNYDTTRTYSRTLAQAFPDERATCVYLPPKRYAGKAVNWALAAALVVVILSVIFQGAPK